MIAVLKASAHKNFGILLISNLFNIVFFSTVGTMGGKVTATSNPETPKSSLQNMERNLLTLLTYYEKCIEDRTEPEPIVCKLLHSADIKITSICQGNSIHITFLCRTVDSLNTLWTLYTTEELQRAFQALYQSEYNRLQPEMQTPRDAVVSVSVELSEDEYRLCKSELANGHQDTEVEGDCLVTSPISQTSEGEPEDERKLAYWIMMYILPEIYVISYRSRLLSGAKIVGKECMYLCCTVTQCMTMELRAMVMFYSELPSTCDTWYIILFYCRRAENGAGLNCCFNARGGCDRSRSALRSKSLSSVILLQ